MKRFLAATLGLFFCVLPAVGQQNSDSPKRSDKEQKTKKEEQAQKTAPQKPAETPAPAEQKNEPSKDKDDDKDKDKEEHYDVGEVPPVVTHHQITVNGSVLKYTATTGRLPLKRGDGKTEAAMFFVAYTLDGADAAKRPVTFTFNGGPGSATIWLHMGALGPRHVALKPDGFMPPAPFHIEDNASTLLDKSDLVFIDAMNTGFSRAANNDMAKKYMGVQGDIKAFGEFIRLYLTRNERWNSPLFLFGESYGTTRAAGLAGYLADRGIAFNGISLLSMALTFQTLENSKSNDEPYILLIPSFTNIAGYHHKLPADLAGDLTKAREQSEQWASTEYTQALAKGDALTGDERAKVIANMSRFIGLNKDVIDQANLRIDVQKFTHYLLLDQKLRVGRLDGRFTGTDPDGLLDTPFSDPTEPAIVPPYTSVFNNYVRAELGYKTDMPYRVFPDEDGSFDKNWDWGSAAQGYPDTATALRQALVKDPYLKVQVLEGYYDLATPYFAANYTMDHLDLGPQFRKNFSFATYEAGHMVYLPADGLKKLKADTGGFMEKAMAGN
jgi:carboxypeptidase C (cathepsin A)